MLRTLWKRKPGRLVLSGLAVALVTSGAAVAQGQPAARPKPAETKPAAPAAPAVKQEDAARPANDPLVATVEGHMIALSDVGRAVPSLPEPMRRLPFPTLFPVVLDRVIDHKALAVMARRQHLEDDPQTRLEIEAATERVLEASLLRREAASQVTEDAVQTRFARQYAGRTATEETHASHILVASEEEARRLIDLLDKGADFALLAKQYSKDPDGAKGGDLGFFRRDQVWPDFADVAFALPPGQFSKTPIHNEFGWHVVKVEERRIVPPPSYAQMREVLRKELLQEAVQRVIEQARSQVSIHKYNVDGSLLATVPDVAPAAPLEKPAN
jgi:peptidyl-prolyl cis-trans isomerase C